MKSRIMYIERKTGGSQTVIGRVTFSKSGKTLYYKDMAFLRLKKGGIYGNYAGYHKEMYLYDCNKEAVPISEDFILDNPADWYKEWHPTGYLGEYWISGPKKDGTDRLYAMPVVHIDEDVREEYWLTIRNKPECVNQKFYS